MTKEVWFYLILFLFVVFGGASAWRSDGNKFTWNGGMGSVLLVVLLFLLLGLQVFGSPVK